MSQKYQNHPNPLPEVPPRALLVSMALRLHHDFALNKAEGSLLACGFTPAEREIILIDMERLYEEVAGQGFYQWDGRRDQFYNAIGKGESAPELK